MQEGSQKKYGRDPLRGRHRGRQKSMSWRAEKVAKKVAESPDKIKSVQIRKRPELLPFSVDSKIKTGHVNTQNLWWSKGRERKTWQKEGQNQGYDPSPLFPGSTLAPWWVVGLSQRVTAGGKCVCIRHGVIVGRCRGQSEHSLTVITEMRQCNWHYYIKTYSGPWKL